jgi:hypothetical protein
MKMLGRDSGEVRLPMTPLDSGLTDQLRRSLADFGLL